jgi:plastocyanin
MRHAGVLMVIAITFLLGMALLILAPASSVSYHGGNLTYAFAVIQIKNGTFEPDHVCVYKNATVVWVNQGPQEHAISVGGDISPPILPGASYTKNFHDFGSFNYTCLYHPGERGVVIVR